MCIHVFGGASSPGCCNYSLKKTAIDNEAQFGPEVAKILMRNFYVNDLLKSTPDGQSAISLIKAEQRCVRLVDSNLASLLAMTLWF